MQPHLYIFENIACTDDYILKCNRWTECKKNFTMLNPVSCFSHREGIINVRATACVGGSSLPRSAINGKNIHDTSSNVVHLFPFINSLVFLIKLEL